METYTKMVKRGILGQDISIEVPQDYETFINCISENMSGDGAFALFIGNFVSHISYRSKGTRKIDAYYKWQQGYRMIDDTCGRIVELLEKCRKDDNTILVFYGDYGDDLWGHGLHNGYTHAIEPYSHLIHTPLIVKNAVQQKVSSEEMVSAIDLKDKILNMIFNSQGDSHKRKYAFARNIFANQQANIFSLGKGYSVVKDDYILLVSPKGLELYNINMDVTNVCNLLDFFKMDSKGNIRFIPELKNVKSMHFRDFFTDGEIRHIVQVYRCLRKILLCETEKLYKTAHKGNAEINKELRFNKIHRLHYYNMYNHLVVDTMKEHI